MLAATFAQRKRDLAQALRAYYRLRAEYEEEILPAEEKIEATLIELQVVVGRCLVSI